jgi:hypothetical protein
MTAVNLMSTRSYGEFEFWFSSIKVAAILAFIAITASYAFGWSPAAQGGLSNLVDHGGFAPHGWGAVLAGVTSVIFALCGAEIATIAAAESSDPAKVIARLTHSVAMRILLFYVLSIALIMIVVPWTDITPGVSPFATALGRIGIPGAATIMNIVVLVAVLSCLNSGLYVTSRMLFTLAARGDAPAGLVKLNRRGVPARSILIGSVLGYVAVIASVVSPERVFSFLVNASGATMLFIYLLAAFAQLYGSGGLLKSASADWFAADPFVNGETAMQWGGLWMLPDITAKLSDDFGVLPFPAIGSGGRQAVPFGSYGATVSAKGTDPEAAKAFVKWLWIDQEDFQVDFSNAYGTHIPAKPALVPKADKIASGPGAEAARFVDELGHAPDKLWTQAISQAMVAAVTNVATKKADPKAEVATVAAVATKEIARVK